jgi:hypothetical protein
MKRFTAMFLTAIYLLASVGVAVNVHYCGGKVAFVKLYTGANCPCGDAMDEDGCCHDETVLFQLEDEQRSVSHKFEFNSQWAGLQVLEVPLVHDPLPEQPGNINLAFFNLPPPPDLPVWLTNCSLTYYG